MVGEVLLRPEHEVGLVPAECDSETLHLGDAAALLRQNAEGLRAQAPGRQRNHLAVDHGLERMARLLETLQERLVGAGEVLLGMLLPTPGVLHLLVVLTDEKRVPPDEKASDGGRLRGV
jgi:hypothetical protein